MSSNKLCRVCGNPIPASAKKCTTCDEYQNPLHRALSGNVLNSLIALVPICTLAFTFVYDRFETKASDLQFTLTSCNDKHIELFASNLGNRSAIISAAEFSTNGDTSQPLIINLKADEKLISGGETRSVVLKSDDNISPGGLVPFAARQAVHCSIKVRLHSVSFNQQTAIRELTCACPTS